MISFTLFNNLFPLWAIVVSILAFLFNEPLTDMQGLIVPMLAMVMFCMGLTLSVEDFKRVTRKPVFIAIGVALQFLLMPLAAFLISHLLQLSDQLTAGMIVVGSCAGGTASNVICYLGKGDVALSISMTLVSTLLGVVITPLLCALYLSQTIAVDTVGMFMNILQVVLIPVLAGTVVKTFLHDWVKRIESILPTIAMTLILLIIAVIVALNSGQLAQVGVITLIAVALHNSTGLAGGYYLSRMLGLDQIRSRTIAIEVGMQNSGLGVALALEFFSATAALPGAIFSVWHNISGSLLAAYWRRKKTD